ncbi:unnamed protein product [Caretta caretta]
MIKVPVPVYTSVPRIAASNGVVPVEIEVWGVPLKRDLDENCNVVIATPLQQGKAESTEKKVHWFFK